ncbi:MAG: ribonuclease III [Erysipelotrichia bacterium]|nr:ribonuclease III [Erysipelotrichia bacterium]
MESRVINLLKTLNIKHLNLATYEQALTHPSFNGDVNSKHKDYEKLEFIGDAVLGYVVADLVYKNRPEMAEGDLTKLRSALVSTKPLAAYARTLKLDEYVRIGHSITPQQVKRSDKILENVFEALIGAIYLDIDLPTAYDFIKSLLLEDILGFDAEKLTDYKSKLQEEIQTEHREAVTYITVSMTGPAHDRTFKVQVQYNGIVLGSGVGKSKKKAEEMAAKDALSKRRVL